ncbi:MAG: hypothetical protein RL711_541 [Bacteroidota bacterium]|jgi:hypothetical protein
MKQHSKNNHLKKGIYFALLFTMVTIGSFAQQKEERSKNKGWVLLKTKDNISIYYQSKKCSNEKVVLVRIVNNNTHNGIISWSLWGEEMANQYAVAGNVDISGSCPNTKQTDTNFDLVAYIPSHKSLKDLKANFKVD